MAVRSEIPHHLRAGVNGEKKSCASIRIAVNNRFAERVGFEPTIPLPVYHLSRVANSTALAPLRKMTVYSFDS